MIEVKMMFKDQAELLAFFTAGGAAQLASAATQVAPAAEKVTAGKSASSKAAATPTATVTAAAKAEPAAASPSDPKPTAAATQAAAPTASSEKPADSVDYPTLQKAVFALANASREAAGAVATTFGVKTFKELPDTKWGEALAAVNAKLEDLANVGAA